MTQRVQGPVDGKVDGGIMLTLALLVLLIGLAVVVYLRVMVPAEPSQGEATVPAASKRIVEIDSTAAQEGATATVPAEQHLQPLPDEQLQLIRDVFAPELSR